MSGASGSTGGEALSTLARMAHALAAGPAGESDAAAAELLAACSTLGVRPAPVGPIYRALADDRLEALTVPAFNVRGLTFDVATAVYRRAVELDAGGLMFELAPSEAAMGDQSFAQYAALVCAAAATAGYRGPVLLQGDHFEVRAPAGVEETELLARSALAGGFMQLDIDAAGLAVDGPDAITRQTPNAVATAALIARLTPVAPAGTIFGGEVGEIGGANTTPEELEEFIDLVRRHAGAAAAAFGKVSVQTGTRHGGMADASGKPTRMPLDLGLARELANVARAKGFGGIVQHGASTLQPDQFKALPGAGVVEVHLATRLQDIIFDSASFPVPLLEEMRAVALTSDAGPAERGGASGGSDGHLFRQKRWSLWGPFKRRLLDLPLVVRERLADEVADWAATLMVDLGLAGRATAIARLYGPRTSRGA